MKNGDKEFLLIQEVSDGRGGYTQAPFDAYRTWKDAKFMARRELKGKRWIIVKQEIVAMSERED